MTNTLDNSMTGLIPERNISCNGGDLSSDTGEMRYCSHPLRGLSYVLLEKIFGFHTLLKSKGFSHPLQLEHYDKRAILQKMALFIYSLIYTSTFFEVEYGFYLISMEN